MPSSFTASLRFEAQFTGENVNTWGTKLSNTLGRVDDAIAGYVAIPITGNYTLVSANSNASADEARRAHLKFTGTLAVNATITIPGVSKSYWVWNATNKALSFSTGAGAVVTIDAGDILPIWTDGAGVRTLSYGVYPLKDYIGTIAAGSGAVPGVAGNASKYLFSDGAAYFWRQPVAADLSDYSTAIKGLQVALAVAL